MTVTFHPGNQGYESMTFPAGEQHIKVGPQSQVPYVVIRGANADDYITAAMWIDVQHQANRQVAAIVPYLPGARQDRGVPFGAAIYAGLINSMQADQVIYFDPHSEVMPGLIENGKRVDVDRVIEEALGELAHDFYDGVIAPDAVAVHRAQLVANILGLPVHQATKERNPQTGKLSKFVAPEDLPFEGTFLVVDDICDGGGTFLGLHEAVTGGAPFDPSVIRLDLWVSHGVFSGSIAQSVSLHDRYVNIYTTNSHPGHGNSVVRAGVLDIISILAEEISL